MRFFKPKNKLVDQLTALTQKIDSNSLHSLSVELDALEQDSMPESTRLLLEIFKRTLHHSYQRKAPLVNFEDYCQLTDKWGRSRDAHLIMALDHTYLTDESFTFLAKHCHLIEFSRALLPGAPPVSIDAKRKAFSIVMQKECSSGIQWANYDFLEIVSECSAPMMIALLQSQKLLDGVYPGVETDDVRLALDWSCRYGYHRLASLLLCDTRTDPQHSIMLASRHGHLEIVQLLLQDDRALSAFSGNATPLTEAYEYNQVEVVRFLLDGGYDQYDSNFKQWPVRLASMVKSSVSFVKKSSGYIKQTSRLYYSRLNMSGSSDGST